MQFGAQGIENMFITSIICNMVLKKTNFEKNIFEKKPFYSIQNKFHIQIYFDKTR
jgi:hypothetical protein